ncbi:type IV pili twitching motility protein PilT [candidate division WOR-3 bacterium]|uniref:Type IV pili twitching motility protein PilT n=1 Tax=candidate division WOR-3 bacterium TaxID=2052148 RepID=A0A660SMH2_UNCW3|nr:MAG: type IV pili twitching motility protein PilT [candidate division WOR-3 bacterium]
MELKSLLEKMIRENASDLHLKAGSPPVYRIDGRLVVEQGESLTPEVLKNMAFQIMTPEQQNNFMKYKEQDFAISIRGIGRFRVNVFMQRGSVAIAMRAIPVSVRRIDELNLPPILKELALKPRGLIICTGTTGSGKSTTLAAMIEHINEHQARHIITVEDPIEYLFRDKKSIICQREVGMDTMSFSTALRHVMRQDPDVILIGEIRDRETMDVALKAADTGHLVLTTLHTLNATETINRIISFYPPHQHEHIRVLLAATLVGVISLRLLARADTKGRIPAVEVLISTPTIRDYLLDPVKTLLIQSAIEEGYSQYGMQTFDQSIFKLYKDGLITYEDALQAVTNPDEFKLKLVGIESTAERGWKQFEK